MQQLQYNPFSVNTTFAAWSDRDSSLPIRAAKASAGLLYDVLVKNPYEMSIGNAKRLIIHRKEHSKKELAVGAVATFLSSCLACVMLGTTLHVSGRLLQVAESPIAIKAAQGLQLAGRKIFVAGGVPLYGLFYAAPKQIMKHLLEACRFVANKVKVAAQFAIKNLLVPAWKHVIYPALKQLGKAFEKVTEKVVQVVEQLFKNVILPLWNKVVYPLLSEALEKCRWLIAKSYKALKYCLTELFKKVLLPIINNVITPCFRLLDKSIRYLAKLGFQSLEFLAKKTIEAFNWTLNTLIIPFCKRVGAPALKMLVSSLSYLISKTSQAAKWLFRTLIVPVWTKVVYPTSIWLKKEFVTGLQKINQAYNRVIIPVIAMIQERMKSTAHAFRAIRQEVVETWASISLRLANLTTR